MLLRTYKHADFDDLVTSWRAASVVAHPFLSPEFLDAEVTSIRDVYLPAAETWVAVDEEKDDKVIGFLALIGNEVGAIFVHPAYWKKGIGRALMNKAVELRKRLTVEVFAENEIGRAFYAKFGFETKGKSLHKETGQAVLQLEFKAAKRVGERD
jgi:putative acetyltransferase